MSEPYEDLDDEEFAAQQRQAAQRKKMIAIAVVVAVVLALALAIGAKKMRGTKKDAAKLSLRNAVAKFEANPVDEELTKSAAAEYESIGDAAKADEIRKKHESAIAKQDAAREQDLRSKIAGNPDDAAAVGQLVELLAKKKDLQGAKALYAELVKRDPSRRDKYGAWLYRNGLYQDAVQELSAVLKDNEDPFSRGYLGLALLELGKKKEARRELNRALDEGGEIEAVRIKLAELEAEMGEESAAPAPQPKATKKAPSKKRKSH